jgi:hypothetical protein
MTEYIVAGNGTTTTHDVAMIISLPCPAKYDLSGLCSGLYSGDIRTYRDQKAQNLRAMVVKEW